MKTPVTWMLALVAAFVTTTSCGLGQDRVVDIVTLGDGRILRGRIFETTPGIEVKMRLPDRTSITIPISTIRDISTESASAIPINAEQDLSSYILLGRDSAFVLGEIIEQFIGNNTNTYRREEFNRHDVQFIRNTDTIVLTLKNGWTIYGTDLDWSRTGDLTLTVLPSILVKTEPDGKVISYLQSDVLSVQDDRPVIPTLFVEPPPQPDLDTMSRMTVLNKKRKGVGASVFGGYPLYFGISAGGNIEEGWGMHLSVATENPMVFAYLLLGDTNSMKVLLEENRMIVNLQAQISMPLGEDWSACFGGGISYQDLGDFSELLPTFSSGFYWYMSDQAYLVIGTNSEPVGGYLGIGFSNITSLFFGSRGK